MKIQISETINGFSFGTLSQEKVPLASRGLGIVKNALVDAGYFLAVALLVGPAMSYAALSGHVL